MLKEQTKKRPKTKKQNKKTPKQTPKEYIPYDLIYIKFYEKAIPSNKRRSVIKWGLGGRRTDYKQAPGNFWICSLFWW